MTLKLYTSVEKVLKHKVRKFFGANSYICRSYMGKTGKTVTVNYFNTNENNK